MLVVMGLDTDIVGFTFTHMDPYFLMSGNGVLIHTNGNVDGVHPRRHDDCLNSKVHLQIPLFGEFDGEL